MLIESGLKADLQRHTQVRVLGDFVGPAFGPQGHVNRYPRDKSQDSGLRLE